MTLLAVVAPVLGSLLSFTLPTHQASGDTLGAVPDSVRVIVYPRAHWPWVGYSEDRPERWVVACDSLNRPRGSKVQVRIPLVMSRVYLVGVETHGRAGWSQESNLVQFVDLKAGPMEGYKP
jgi:hypothetical protein